MAESQVDRGGRRAAIITLILLALAALAIVVWGLLNDPEETDFTPGQPTTQTREDDTNASPGQGNNSVTQGGDEDDPTTPSSSGTGANTMLAPSIPPN